MLSAAALDAAVKAQDDERSLKLLAELRANDSWNWDLLIRVPNFWEHSKSVAQAVYDLMLALGDRGVDLKAFAQASLRRLRHGSTPGAVQHAASFLRHAVEAWRRAAGWPRVDWEPYASDLVELLSTEHRDLALALLRLALEHQGESFAEGLSTSLFIRWTELSDEVHAQLQRELEPLAPGLLASSKREQPELSPLHAAEVLAQLGDASPPYVVALGNISPVPNQATRCLFYRIDDTCLKPLGEQWVCADEVSKLLGELRARGQTFQACCDAMYATAAERIWIDDPFTYWEDLSRRIWREGDTLCWGNERLPLCDLLRVEAYLEQAWVLRGVRLWIRKDGAERSIKLAEVEDHISEIDPTYDGLNISFETEWAVNMARSISQALKIPCEKDEAMF